MTSTISDTVNTTMAANGLGSYAGHARPVVEALTQREQEMADALIGFATQQGLDEETAAAALRQVGMTLPAPPPPVATLASADRQNQANTGEPRHRAEGDDDLTVVLARINNTLEDLAGFARQNGWRPTR
jgi:hypothetical protein